MAPSLSAASRISAAAACILCFVLAVHAASPEVVGSEEEYRNLKDSSNVALVEFYSKMCGSCKEFSKHWKKAAGELGDEVIIKKVCIDDAHGMKIANSVGALSRGIPHVRLLVSKDGEDEALVAGRSIPSASLVNKVRSAVKSRGLQRDSSGKFLKAGANEDL